MSTPQTNTEINLEFLVAQRVEAKREEDRANERRRQIDEQIAALLPKPGDKSTASTKLDSMALKVTVTYGENVKVDAEALRAALLETDALKALPADVVKAFRWKPEIESKAWALLSAEDKLLASKFVTRTPASPSVKLEVA